ncbi:MAG: right-handed parallel beta-helix repeat-containing protein [Clostridia bacterium]|nr:right-handed parallel beta-helix repeat-containing protein [Clostridia bacterium]
MTIYVSPDGDDSGDGTADAPLATVDGARNAVRNYRSENGIPDGGIEVVFAPGVYSVNAQTVFTSEDSGEEGSPVIYRSAEKGGAVFDGAVTIDPSLFVPVSGKAKDIIQDEQARSKVLEADLTEAGCWDLDDTAEYQTGWVCHSYRQELYVDGKRQTVSRWPNVGYDTAAGYNDGEGCPYLVIPEEKAVLWSKEKVRFFGYPVYDWDSLNLGSPSSAAVDAERSVFLFLNGTGYFSIQGAAPVDYFLYNLLCELDTPGEYYWDTESGKLYWYPDGSSDGRKISFSQFAGQWFVMNGASDISFEGFVFENGRADIFSGSDTGNARIIIDSCVFRDMGGYPVNLTGSFITVKNCEMYELGAGCISLTGGVLNDVKSAGSVVTNNSLHDYSQTYTVYNPAVTLSGYGFTVSHNEIFNAPHEGIAFNCGGSVIEYNYIHDVCLQTSDAGAVYSGRRWDWSENIIRYNFIENVTDRMFGGTPHAIYLDDCLSGQRCYGNILKNIAGCALLAGGGKFNRIENNIFTGTSYPIILDARGIGREFMHDSVTYPDGYMWQCLRSNIDYLSEMQRFAVPLNLLMVEQTGLSMPSRADDPGTPTYGIIAGNLLYGDGDPFSDDTYPVTVVAYDNIRYTSDPGFAGADSGDYSLGENSIVFRDIPGFENIDCSKIGIIEQLPD